METSNELFEILSKLKNPKRQADGSYKAHCPAHDDQNPSLSVTEKDGRVLLCCHAGCEYEAIIEALGLERPARSEHKGGQDVVYDYVNAEGNLVYQVVRRPDKKFMQRQPNGNGGFIWSIKNIKPIPYRLPETLAAIKERRIVYVVEGEKDSNNLARLGLTATCNSGGAGKWRTEHSEHLRGADVVVIPDDDDPGHKHASAVVDSLRGVAKSISIVKLPNPTGRKGFDVSDWLTAGGTPEELERMAAAAKPIEAGGAQPGRSQRERFNAAPYAEKILEYHRLKYQTNVGFYLYEKTLKYWRRIHDDFIRQLCSEALGKAESTTRQRNEVFELLKLDSAVMLPPNAEMNPNTNLIDCKNGMLNPATGELQPHDYKFLSTTRTPLVYDPAAECPLWNKTLTEWQPDPADRLTLQEFAGYVFSDLNFEKAAIFIGSGANGKSVFVSVLSEMVGAENVSHISPDDAEKPFHAIHLFGKRLNIGNDVSDRELMLTGILKSAISCQPITDSFKHRDVITFTPRAKHIFCMNAYPRTADRSEGFFRRWIVIDWPRTFKESEQNPNLANELLAERDGIFAWAIQGLARLRENGRFTISDSGEANMEQFRRVSDPVRVFLDDCADTTDPNAETPSATLYQAYRAWTQSNGFRTASSEHFGRELRRVVPNAGSRRKRIGDNRENFITGVRLTASSTGDFAGERTERSGWSG